MRSTSPSMTPMHEPKTERSCWTFARAARFAVGVLAVGGVITLLVRDRSSLSVLSDASLPISAVVVAIMSLNTVMFGVRVRLVLDHVGSVAIASTWWMRVFVNSFALNLSVPQSGAVYRAVELRDMYGMSLATYLRSYYVVVWLAYILVLATGTVVMYAQETAPAVGGWDIRTLLATTLLGVVLGPLLLRTMAHRWSPKTAMLRRLTDEVAAAVTTAVGAVLDGHFAHRFTVLSAATIVTDVAIVVLTAQALSLELDFAWAMVLYVTLQLFNLLTSRPETSGCRNWSSAY